MQSALHDRSCPGSGSVEGMINLFKNFSLGVTTKHLGGGGKSMMKVS